jgi:hypothetical protein
VTVSACFTLDFFFYSYNVLIKTTPASFLRQLISKGRSIENIQAQKEFEKISSNYQLAAKLKVSNRRKIADHRQELLSQIYDNPNN